MQPTVNVTIDKHPDDKEVEIPPVPPKICQQFACDAIGKQFPCEADNTSQIVELALASFALGALVGGLLVFSFSYTEIE